MDFRRGVLVIGGGIAGASLALALARRTIPVELVERQPVWEPIGAGMFLYSNGVAALDRIGVMSAILETGWASPDGRNPVLAADGTPITELTYPRIGGPSVPPILGILRADLHRAISGELRRENVAIRLGTSITAFVEDEAQDCVAATFSDGSRQCYDLVIGADGIRSSVRELLFGQIKPTFTGFGVWRSMHDRPASIDAKIMMMGVGKRLGIMPISDDRLYIFGTTREENGTRYEPAQWHLLMREKLAEFGGPAASLLDEITRPDQVVYTGVEEIRLPLPWHRGRIGLIGDAAHASSPFMGQGGSMAIEDAVVLAEMLSETGPSPDTLAAFAERRFARCSFVQEASRKVGEAGGIEDEAACRERDVRLRRDGQAGVDAFYGVMSAAI